jgi:hypothetical protein
MIGEVSDIGWIGHQQGIKTKRCEPRSDLLVPGCQDF